MRLVIVLFFFVSCKNIARKSLKLKAIQCQSVDSLLSIRGIGIYKNTVWLSGSNGKVYKSDNTGKSYKNISPIGFKGKDFRDIHVFNNTEALIMSAGDSAVFLKTTNGGITWRVVYENNTPGIFFDAVDFNHKIGYAVSDPMKDNDSVSRFYLIKSDDEGNTWKKVKDSLSPKSLPNEAIFAASGSSLLIDELGNIKIVTGSTYKSRMLTFKNNKWTEVAMPFCKGEFTGAYSFDRFKDNIIAAGGTFLKPNLKDSVLCFSEDRGKNWKTIKGLGYFSGVHFINDTSWIAAGTSGFEFRSINTIIYTDTTYKNLNVCLYQNPYFYIGGYNGKIIQFKLE